MKDHPRKILAAGLPTLLFAACTGVTGPTDPMEGEDESADLMTEAQMDAAEDVGAAVQASTSTECSCEPEAKILIEPDGVNEVGEAHTIKAKVFSRCGGDFQPVEGAVVHFELKDGSVGYLSSTSCTTNAYGKCTVDLHSNEVGTSVVEAKTTVDVNGTYVHVETDGTCDNSDPIKKRWVDAVVTIDPHFDENGLGEEHIFHVLCKALQPDGMDAPSFEIDYLVTPDPDHIESNCDSPDVTGNEARCYIEIKNFTAETFIAKAECKVTMSDTIHDVPYSAMVVRKTDGSTTPSGACNSDPAEKVYVAGSLKWKKVDENHDLLGGATFEACRVEDRFGAPVMNECVEVTDNDMNDADPDDGQFELTDLPLGKYVVKEIVAPAGYILDPDAEHAELSLGYPDAFVGVFKNMPEEVLGDEGCTLGYWKNHTDSWPATLDPNDEFFEVFSGVMNTRGLPDDLTLIGALNLGGGHANKVARQGVAALLNAKHFDVDYSLTSAQVKAAVANAFNTGDYSVGDLFDTENNEGCPLN